MAISIVGVLIALLLPAVQQARETARRLQCQNNLKQLALATQNYASAKNSLPPSGLVDKVTQTYAGRTFAVFDQQSGEMISWAVLLLPYLEESALADRFDVSRNILDQPGDPQAQFLPSLACPSDNAQGRYFYTSSGQADGDAGSDSAAPSKQFAKGNYAAYASPYHLDQQALYPGAFILGGQSTGRVFDGLSKTIGHAEIRTLEHPRDERGAWALPWSGASLLAMDMHHDSSQGIFNPFLVNLSLANQSQTPNHQGPNSDVLLECPEDGLAEAQINGMPCTRWRWPLGLFGYISAAPRSAHLGGVYVNYLDGRVGFLPDDIDPVVMALSIGVNDSGVVPTDTEVAAN